MSAPELSYDDLVRIADLIDAAAGYQSFHVSTAGFAIEIERAAPQQAMEPVSPPQVPERRVTVVAPTVGTFRRIAPTQDAIMTEPGHCVSADTPLGCVDVLGASVPVLAGSAGTLAALLVEDGAPVGYGQPVAELSVPC